MMLRSRRVLGTSLFVLAMLGTSSLRAVDPQSTNSLTAEQILERMVQVYSECSSYQDTGSVLTTNYGNDRTWTEEIEFWTSFIRPNRFRFEYREKDFQKKTRCYIIWSNGTETKTWWDVRPGIKPSKSLYDALCAATGVSSVSSHTVPVLLLPLEAAGRRPMNMMDVQRADDAVVFEQPCFVLFGRCPGKDTDIPQKVWIDKATYLVKKIERSFHFESGHTAQVTTYKPILNGSVPDKLLDFDPPKGE